MNDQPRQVYFSYKWGDESERIVKEISAALKARGIGFILDKADLGYKGQIGDFMREIGRGKVIVVVICDKYLTSDNTMFELVEIAKSKDVHERIFPIILKDADIYNPVNRIKYIKHWEDKKKTLNEAMRTVDLANLQGITDEINNYDTIRDHVARLTSLLKDMNALTPELHENSNFSILISAIEKKLNDTFPSAVHGATGETPSADGDPWGDAEGKLRVFLATPDQDREKLHAQLSKALQSVEGVRVVDSVSLDEQKHAETVGSLVRRADLCVHLLAARPGKRLDVDDGQPLRTYPLEQLEIARQAGRPQLVIMATEDKESIENEKYAARVDELAKLPRDDKSRFELLITDKNLIAGEVKAKIEELKRKRREPGASDGVVRTAFVDSHDIDQESASDLVTFLSERNVEAFMQTSDSSGSDELARFADNLKKYPLYIIVAGGADATWVKHRTNAARTSAVKARAEILIGRYEESEKGKVTMSRLKVVAAIKRVAPDPIDSLFPPTAGEKA